MTKPTRYYNKPTRFYSDRQEKAVAAIVHGRQTANSGAGIKNKGDVDADNIVIECKTLTEEKKSQSIKKAWLKEIEKIALEENKDMYALAIDFGNPKEQYFILDGWTFKRLYEYFNGKEE